jgi:hypothetical protein
MQLVHDLRERPDALTPAQDHLAERAVREHKHHR